jgi:hypothetical protein
VRCEADPGHLAILVSHRDCIRATIRQEGDLFSMQRHYLLSSGTHPPCHDMACLGLGQHDLFSASTTRVSQLDTQSEGHECWGLGLNLLSFLRFRNWLSYGPCSCISRRCVDFNGTSGRLPETLIGLTCVQLDEYYPYKEELKMLGVHAERIVDFIPRGAILVELGCGSATKTSTLLNAMLNRYACQGSDSRWAVYATCTDAKSAGGK